MSRFGIPPAFVPCMTEAASAIQAARWALKSEEIARRDAILDFWFGKGWRATPIDVAPNMALWFGGSAETDKQITELFAEDVLKARRGELSHWQNAGPLECLALIILLDQFALNIYREQPEGYLASERAIPIAYTAVAREYDRQEEVHTNDTLLTLPSPLRMFFYLPLMHSELLQDQNMCVDLCSQMAADDDEDEDDENSTVAFAIAHRDIIAKYGRFPGRNKVMGRESTAEEVQYLAEGGVF